MNVRSLMATVLSAAAIATMPSDARAHHGWSGYDSANTLTISGSITESSYANPHGLIRLKVDGKEGKTWLVVLAPPARMNNRGLLKEMLQVGTRATVVGYPHRQNADELRAERITVGRKTTELR